MKTILNPLAMADEKEIGSAMRSAVENDERCVSKDDELADIGDQFQRMKITGINDQFQQMTLTDKSSCGDVVPEAVVTRLGKSADKTDEAERSFPSDDKAEDSDDSCSSDEEPEKEPVKYVPRGVLPGGQATQYGGHMNNIQYEERMVGRKCGADVDFMLETKQRRAQQVQINTALGSGSCLIYPDEPQTPDETPEFLSEELLVTMTQIQQDFESHATPREEKTERNILKPKRQFATYTPPSPADSGLGSESQDSGQAWSPGSQVISESGSPPLHSSPESSPRRQSSPELQKRAQFLPYETPPYEFQDTPQIDDEVNLLVDNPSEVDWNWIDAMNFIKEDLQKNGENFSNKNYPLGDTVPFSAEKHSDVIVGSVDHNAPKTVPVYQKMPQVPPSYHVPGIPPVSNPERPQSASTNHAQGALPIANPGQSQLAPANHVPGVVPIANLERSQIVPTTHVQGVIPIANPESRQIPPANNMQGVIPIANPESRQIPPANHMQGVIPIGNQPTATPVSFHSLTMAQPFIGQGQLNVVTTAQPVIFVQTPLINTTPQQRPLLPKPPAQLHTLPPAPKPRDLLLPYEVPKGDPIAVSGRDFAKIKDEAIIEMRSIDDMDLELLKQRDSDGDSHLAICAMNGCDTKVYALLRRLNLANEVANIINAENNDHEV